MLATVAALGVRIFSNPIANLVQKILSEKHSAILINLYSYAFLSLFCLAPAISNDWSEYGISYWMYASLAGVLCTLGSVCLIKALQCGEMSVLGPVNSYKCVVGLILGGMILGEIPSILALVGVVLIIFGSWYVFDTVDGGFKPSLLLRKDIMLRFCALFFSGCEAVVLKKIILMSSIMESFILWCFMGLVFSLVLLCCFRRKFELLKLKEFSLTVIIALMLGLMQYSTNFVFERMNVGLALALFQLSTIVSVVFGYKVFHENDFWKKILGSVIMIVGSCLILLK